jgi:hypothetical protein
MSKRNVETAGHERVRASKHGYLISHDSNWQGATSGQVLLVRYCREFPEGLALGAAINDTGTTHADQIAEAARAMLRDSADRTIPGLRVIRTGYIIR